MHRLSSRFTHLVTLSFLLVAGILQPGCSTYQNVTGYFNTYYNARKLFSEAVDEMYRVPLKERDSNYFALPKPGGPVETKFDKVIEKGSKVIQFYPESRWVDDALMMIGRSDVYLGDYESGIRKFNELLENFPTSDLRFEAKLWIAKAEYYTHRDDDALRHLAEVVDEAAAGGNGDVVVEALLLEAQIAIERSDYPAAVKALSRTSEDIGEKRVRAFAQFQLGQCYEILGDYENALQAYRHSRELTSDPVMDYRSRLRVGVMLTKTERYEDAFAHFGDLREEPLKPDELSLVELEIGNIYAAMGDTGGAFDAYRFVDSTFKRSDAAAMSYYRRGLMFEEEYGDFRSALGFFDMAKGESPSSPIVKDAQHRSENLGRYFAIKADLARNDSLLTLALNPELLKALLDSIQAVKDSAARAARLNTASDTGITPTLQQADAYRDSSLEKRAEERGITPTLNQANAYRDSSQGKRVEERGITPTLNQANAYRDSSQGKRVEERGIIPTLNQANAYRDSSQVKRPRAIDVPPSPLSIEPAQTLSEFVLKRTRDRDFEDDREDTLAQESPDTPDSIGVAMVLPDSTGVLPDSAERRVGKTATRQASIPHPDTLRQTIAKNRFELAGLFYLGMNLPDSAQLWYEKVVLESPMSPYTPRSLYSLAEIHRIRGDSAAVDSLHSILVDDHPTSEYTRQVQRSRGVQVESARPDSAEPVYREAERILIAGDTTGAMEQFSSLVVLYPASPFAPKALYTIGWMYENLLLDLDSAAAWYQRLVDAYPKSLYASEVKPKLAVREKPESIDQYIKITEIQAVGHQAAAQRQTQQSAQPRSRPGEVLTDEERLDKQRNARQQDRIQEDEQDAEDEPEADEPEEDPEPD